MAYSISSWVVVFGAVIVVSATPAHSNTIGVTECEDCLAGVRNRMYSWAEGAITTCPEVDAALESCMNGCRPNDPIRMMGIFQMIFNALDCPQTDEQGCPQVFQCMKDNLFYDDGRLGCDGDLTSIGQTVHCLDEVDDQCGFNDVISWMTLQAVPTLCDGPVCITEWGTMYRTVADSECQRFQIEDILTGSLSPEQQTASGTTFNTGKCSQDYPGPDNRCYN